MSNEIFLSLSLAIRGLPIVQKSDFWTYRYSFFVQSSPRGHNCTYSRMCRDKFLEIKEQETLREILSNIEHGGHALKLLNELTES